MGKIAHDTKGNPLTDGDRVQVLCLENGRLCAICGTLHENTENPEVSEWFVRYDDGEECAVFDFSLIAKE
jgi:hypothetical protein